MEIWIKFLKTKLLKNFYNEIKCGKKIVSPVAISFLNLGAFSLVAQYFVLI